MSAPLPDLHAVAEATWPPAARVLEGPWILRTGRGGGKRVSAATARGPVTAADLPRAEAAMRARGQPPLFMVRAGEVALDALLAEHGYAVVDPVIVHAGAIAPLLADRPPLATTFAIWEPLAIQADIWAEGGIGPARLAVMQRAPQPKTALLARDGQSAAATAFAAIHADVVMVHAMHVRPAHRRRGMGRNLMLGAAHWAAARGAGHLAALCTRANSAAAALYASLGLAPVEHYHYRMRPEEEQPQ